MSGKFMNIKRFTIPTITLAIIASQLMGCAAVSQSELLQMINNAEEIEIEIATPINQEQGTEQTLLWEVLASLQTNETLRKQWDDILGITLNDTGKNGMLYVNAEGNHENNNTLRIALHNRAFQKALFEEEATQMELVNAALSQYVDLEEDQTDKALYMAINGYFNLLADHDKNYSNPDSTLTRAEFMAMVMRAETPVDDTLTPDTTFKSAVGDNELNLYAQEVADSAYLDIESKSLNNMTYNGTITRAEAIYLLMNHYFKDELSSVDTKSTQLEDAKDGGNIAEQQKFIEDGIQKDYWKSYELTYAITNPDKGAPTALYNALALAEQKGIIDTETRWDEGLTKATALEFLITTLSQEKGVAEFNYTQGKIAGHESPVEAEAPIQTNEDGATVITLDPETDYIEPTETEDTTSEAASTEDPTPGITALKESVQKDYEDGLISKEDYDLIMDNLNFLDQPEETTPSTPSTPSYTISPESQAMLDAGTTADPSKDVQGVQNFDDAYDPSLAGYKVR